MGVSFFFIRYQVGTLLFDLLVTVLIDESDPDAAESDLGFLKEAFFVICVEKSIVLDFWMLFDRDSAFEYLIGNSRFLPDETLPSVSNRACGK